MLRSELHVAAAREQVTLRILADFGIELRNARRSATSTHRAPGRS